MDHQGPKDQWVDFKGRTGIHGFVEYDGIRNNVARVAWIAFMIVVGVFCGIQLYGLFSAYIYDDPTTSIEVAASAELPDLNLVFEPVFYTIDASDALDAVIKEIITQQNEKFSFGGSCLVNLDSVMGTEVQNTEYAEYGNESESVNEHGEPSLMYLRGWTKEKIQAEVRHYDGAMNAFHEGFKKLLPPAEKIISATDVVKKKVKRELGQGSIEIATAGYVLVIPTSELDTTTMDAIHLTHHPKLSVSYKIGFRAPGGWYIGDLGGFVEIQAGGIDYYLAVSLVVYKRADTYCDQTLNDGMDCFTKCEIDKAKETGSCVQYLGNLTDTEGLKICSFADYTQCRETTRECTDYCRECKSCRPCHEVVTAMTIEREDKTPNHTDESFVQIRIVNGNKVQMFHTVQKYSEVAFLSQIGGILGLCFGVSLVSIMHLLYSVASLLVSVGRKRHTVDEEDDDSG